MNLELKHLASYMPFNLRAVDEVGNELIIDWKCRTYTSEVVGLTHVIKSQHSQAAYCFKPLMTSLSNLSRKNLIAIGLIIREIDDKYASSNDHIFAIDDAKAWIRGGMRPVLSLQQVHQIMTLLFSMHADVFGLIKHGLAIEISVKEKDNEYEY